MKTEPSVDWLTTHPEPLIRWKAARLLLGLPSNSEEIHRIRQDLDHSELLKRLLINRMEDGRLPIHAYNKWFGAHWILSILADLGYPEGDTALKPLLDQCYEWLLSDEHVKEIRTINDRVRRCASQEGNCIYYSLALGLADERTDELAARLFRWQWEDGGWNCDKRPEAATSSFDETLIPLRGLSLFARTSGNYPAQQAVQRAAQVFLTRDLLWRIRDGKILDHNYTRLHYPNYWHYDFLFALKVLAEAGFIDDPHCERALDLLESKQLPDGGFPAEDKYYRVDDKKLSGHSRVDWGGTSRIHSNPFITLDALIVLKRSGRLVI